MKRNLIGELSDKVNIALPRGRPSDGEIRPDSKLCHLGVEFSLDDLDDDVLPENGMSMRQVNDMMSAAQEHLIACLIHLGVISVTRCPVEPGDTKVRVSFDVILPERRFV